MMDQELIQIEDWVKCPPGGWRYEDDVTGFKAVAFNANDLINQISTYWDANDIPKLGNWREVLMDELCRFNNVEDSHCGQPTKPTVIETDRRLTPQDLLNFLRTVRQWAAKGFAFVEPDESERRAAICATCPMNIEVPGCNGCQGILSHVRDTLNRRANHRGSVPKTTSLDADLQNCEVCGCVLEVKVHLPLEVATYVKPPGGRTYPKHCWMIEDNERREET